MNSVRAKGLGSSAHKRVNAFSSIRSMDVAVQVKRHASKLFGKPVREQIRKRTRSGVFLRHPA
jgi:hypothetical protein